MLGMDKINSPSYIWHAAQRAATLTSPSSSSQVTGGRHTHLGVCAHQVLYSRVQPVQQFPCYQGVYYDHPQLMSARGNDQYDWRSNQSDYSNGSYYWEWTPVSVGVCVCVFVRGCLLSTFSESHSSSQMIKVYKINLDSHFNHAKVLACLTPPSSTASSAQAAARSSIAGIFAHLSPMFGCWNTGKTSHWCCCWPLVVLLFLLLLLLSFWFIIVWSAVFGPTVFTFIKTQPHAVVAFSNGAHRARGPRLTLIASEKNTQKFQPSAAFTPGTNQELWFREWIKFTHQMLVNYL